MSRMLSNIVSQLPPLPTRAGSAMRAMGSWVRSVRMGSFWQSHFEPLFLNPSGVLARIAHGAQRRLKTARSAGFSPFCRHSHPKKRAKARTTTAGAQSRLGTTAAGIGVPAALASAGGERPLTPVTIHLYRGDGRSRAPPRQGERGV